MAINELDVISREQFIDIYKQLKDKQISVFSDQEYLNNLAFEKLSLDDSTKQIIDSRNQNSDSKVDRTCDCQKIQEYKQYVEQLKNGNYIKQLDVSSIFDFKENVINSSVNRVYECNVVQGYITPQCSITSFPVEDYYSEVKVIKELREVDGQYVKRYVQTTEYDGYYVFYSEGGTITIGGKEFNELVEFVANDILEVISDKEMIGYRFDVLSQYSYNYIIFSLPAGNHTLYIKSYTDQNVHLINESNNIQLVPRKVGGLYLAACRIITLSDTAIMIAHYGTEDIFKNIFYDVRWI